MNAHTGQYVHTQVVTTMVHEDEHAVDNMNSLEAER